MNPYFLIYFFLSWFGTRFAFFPAAMVHIETHPWPRLLEMKKVFQTKKDLRRRLAGHQFKRLRILLKKRNGRLALQFVGDPISVEKAKGLLGVS